MARPRYKRTTTEPEHHDEPIPVMLPHVSMSITADGAMTVAVDDALYKPEPFAPPWRREDFARVLDQLTERHRSPGAGRGARGGRHDVHRHHHPQRTPSLPTRTEHQSRPHDKRCRNSLTLHGEGFVPGEDVAVAIVIAHGDAAPDGTMRALLTAEQAASSPTREVILLGRVSGTLTIGHPQ